MFIEIHAFVATIHKVSREDLPELYEVIGIKYELYESSTFSNVETLKYSFNNTESVYMRINGDDENRYVLLVLHGSFFDNSPDFNLRKLLKFLSRFNHTFKQLDVAFVDNKRCLTIKKLKHWCKYHKDFCTGSLVRRKAPRFVSFEGKFERIQLASARSKTNFGTIYRRPDTRFIRIEIKYKSKDKIQYLLENYSRKNIKQFEARCLEVLVGCIDFITARSKKSRVAAKYKRQPEWESFLGSDVKRIRWSKLHEARSLSRNASDKATFDKKLKRAATIVENLVRKYSEIHPEIDVLNQFTSHSSFKLLKKDMFE